MEQASLTPEPSGHCLLSSLEPLLGGINPFLTPVLRLRGVVPKGGDDEAAGRCFLSGLQVLIKQLTRADQLADSC